MYPIARLGGILMLIYIIHTHGCEYMYVCVCVCVCVFRDSPGGTVVKNPSPNAGDVGLILCQEDPLEEKW